MPGSRYLFQTLLPVLLLAWGAAAVAEAPRRVVSINLCTDQLLLMLADPAQVASVSRLARSPENSFVAAQAMGYPVNHARPEEILALRADLVLASEHTSARLVNALQGVGLRVERIKGGKDLEGIVAGIRRLATLLHRKAEGEALVAGMLRRLEAQSQVEGQRPKAIFYQPRGYTSGRGTLQDLALGLAGWRNPAAEAGVEGYRPVDLERVLSWQPDVIFTSVAEYNGGSVAERFTNHPALIRMLAGRKPWKMPYKYWICAGPMVVDAVERLRRARDAIALSGSGEGEGSMAATSAIVEEAR